jgi:hypothetical protein
MELLVLVLRQTALKIKQQIRMILLINVFCVAEIPMPSSPPKATEVRSSGAGKEGEYEHRVLLIAAQLTTGCC